MKRIQPTTIPPEDATVMAALSCVLSADPAEIQDKEAQAKDETPSPHKRWTFVPQRTGPKQL